MRDGMPEVARRKLRYANRRSGPRLTRRVIVRAWGSDPPADIRNLYPRLFAKTHFGGEHGSGRAACGGRWQYLTSDWDDVNCFRCLATLARRKGRA